VSLIVNLIAFKLYNSAARHCDKRRRQPVTLQFSHTLYLSHFLTIWIICSILYIRAAHADICRFTNAVTRIPHHLLEFFCPLKWLVETAAMETGLCKNI